MTFNIQFKTTNKVAKIAIKKRNHEALRLKSLCISDGCSALAMEHEYCRSCLNTTLKRSRFTRIAKHMVENGQGEFLNDCLDQMDEESNRRVHSSNPIEEPTTPVVLPAPTDVERSFMSFGDDDVPNSIAFGDDFFGSVAIDNDDDGDN